MSSNNINEDSESVGNKSQVNVFTGPFEKNDSEKFNLTFQKTMGEGLYTQDSTKISKNINDSSTQKSLMDGGKSLIECLTERRSLKEIKKLDNMMKNTYKYIQSSSEIPPNLTSRKFTMTFSTEKIKNTPYHLLSADRAQELVKEELAPSVAPFEHNGTLDMSRTMSRRPFVDGGAGPHEERFKLLDTAHLSRNKPGRLFER